MFSYNKNDASYYNGATFILLDSDGKMVNYTQNMVLHSMDYDAFVRREVLYKLFGRDG